MPVAFFFYAKKRNRSRFIRKINGLRVSPGKKRGGELDIMSEGKTEDRKHGMILVIIIGNVFLKTSLTQHSIMTKCGRARYPTLRDGEKNAPVREARELPQE